MDKERINNKKQQIIEWRKRKEKQKNEKAKDNKRAKYLEAFFQREGRIFKNEKEKKLLLNKKIENFMN